MSVRSKAIAVLDTYEGVGPEDTYVALIQSIDWNRVQLEAMARCLKLHTEVIKEDSDMPCGPCLEAALLETATFPDY